jgi:hypothetical protein
MPKFKNNLIVNVYNEDASYVRYVLRELGYVSEYVTETEYINGGLVTENTGVYYTTFGRGTNTNSPDYINCGNNIELFLSLASMRDDTDIYQLFVSDTDCSWVNLGMWRNKGDFEFCLVDDYRMGESEFSNSIPPAHKASVDEIKNYLLLNPNYKPYKSWYEKTSVDAILRKMNDLANKIIKSDVYSIIANKEMYECLKKQSVGNLYSEKCFFVMFRQTAINVTLDEYIEYKLILMKNGKPLIFVNNDGTISKVEENNN